METISMSKRERKRLEVFSRVDRGEMTLIEAGVWLGLGYRQTKRVWRRYQDEGDAGLVHRARGRASNHQSAEPLRERVLALYRERYSDYGPTLAAETLAKEDGLQVSVSGLRRWLISAGLWECRRKRRVHRRRRERRSHVGDLLQMDGSHHDWFEGRRAVLVPGVAYAGWAVLMVLIDDATSRVYARFYENESWHSVADVFQNYVARHGAPRNVYVDQHSIYRADREPTGDEILLDQVPETQFGRAMRELDVTLILARSAQAKGRVERMNGTLQDRLVKALRREKISDIASANAFLEKTFLVELNQRFAVAASKEGDWHRPMSSETDLPRILSIQEPRVVQNDWTVRWRNQTLQIESESAAVVRPKQRVTVCEQLDGRLRVFASDVELRWTPAKGVLHRGRKRPSPGHPTGSSQGQKPGPDHPWRRRSVVEKGPR
jgi:transposase